MQNNIQKRNNTNTKLNPPRSSRSRTCTSFIPACGEAEEVNPHQLWSSTRGSCLYRFQSQSSVTVVIDLCSVYNKCGD